MDKGPTPLEDLLSKERRRKIVNALESLDEQDREILALRQYEYLSNAEAAEALGISIEATYKRYARALKRLKQTLESLSDSSSTQS